MQQEKHSLELKIIIQIIFIMCFLSSYGQTKKVHEQCSDDVDCESRNCVTVRDRGETKRVCCNCNQSKLDDYTKIVDEKCETYKNGWKPSSSRLYSESLTQDGMVYYEVFDTEMERAKVCRSARQDRENTCWEGGNTGHKDQINQITQCITDIGEDKKKAFENRAVYYSSKNTYENRLSTYTSRCNSLDFSRISSAFDDASKNISNGNKVNCRDIENYINECKSCNEEVKSLLSSSFNNNTDRFPGRFSKTLSNSQDTYKKGESVLQDIKNKSLCQ